jgi:two-component system phosphate regulon response regulator OmpR
MEQQAHVVVCDDEPDVRDMVCEYLGRRGYAVSAACDGVALRQLVDAGPIDAVILDINMPGEDGLSLARFLRERGDTAIIMLTASGEVVDRIIGLEMGADDYLTKPVDLRELQARIKAVLRRGRTSRRQATAGAGGDTAQIVAFGRCTLDLDAHKLFDADGSEIGITAMEFALLKVFAENAGRVLNRDQLLEQAHDRSWDPFDRSIDIRISRLRRKIEADPTKPQIIRTVRGAGYVFSSG